MQIADIGTEQHPVPFFLKPLRLEDLPYELSANLTQADLDALRAKQELYALRGFGAVMERQTPPANADRTEANKFPDPTPASGTPAAGASVAPPPGAGHS